MGNHSLITNHAKKIGILIYFPLSSILILFLLSFIFSLTQQDSSLNLRNLMDFKIPTLIILMAYFMLFWFKTPINIKDFEDIKSSLLSISTVVVLRTNIYLFPLYLISYVNYAFSVIFHGDFGGLMFVMLIFMGVLPLILAFSFQLLTTIFSAGLLYAYLMRKFLRKNESKIDLIEGSENQVVN